MAHIVAGLSGLGIHETRVMSATIESVVSMNYRHPLDPDFSEYYTELLHAHQSSVTVTDDDLDTIPPLSWLILWLIEQHEVDSLTIINVDRYEEVITSNLQSHDELNNFMVSEPQWW